jgi:hypothetical protein
MLSHPPLTSKSQAKAYAMALNHAIERRSGNSLLDLAYRMRKLIPQFAQREPEKMLTRVGYANLRFLDGYQDVERTQNSGASASLELGLGRR